eukprot:g8657.t1
MVDSESHGVVSAPSESVECDPTRRYWRFEDVLGSGACKTVFKAFDSREGIEVAWNKVPLTTSSPTNEYATMRKRLFSEIQVLKRLQHKNIMTFHDSWLDTKTNTLNFITELFTDGSLKRFRAKHRHLRLQVLKKWAWQILQGLVYLHGHEPPIIHRDLKCDNIFINGVTGDIKVGDLGLATLWKGLAPLSVIGTPEFMAPELYNENYDEQVDVYAFGMLLVELVSMDYPYCECTNPASIYKKVSQGIHPASFQKITNQELKEFIELCIAFDPEKRPKARQLLKHQFFNSVKKTMDPRHHHRNTNDKAEMEPPLPGYRSNSTSSFDSDLSSTRTTGLHQNGLPVESVHSSHSPATSNQPLSETDLTSMEELESPQETNGLNIKIECTKVEDEPILDFSLEYQKPGSMTHTIQFPFNIEEDTAEKIIMEMRDESFNEIDIFLNEQEAAIIGQLIDREVHNWRVKDEGQLEAYVNVTRRHPIIEPTPEVSISDEARQQLELKMEDMCETMAAGQGRAHYFRTLDEHSSAIMDCMDCTLRKAPRHRLHPEDELNSESGTNEEQVLFSNGVSTGLSTGGLSQSVEAQLPPECIPKEKSEIMSEKSVGIEIPKKRRMSLQIEQSNSISSTLSDAHLHHTSDGCSSPTAKSALRRGTGMNFLTTEFQLPKQRTGVRKSVNLTTDDNALDPAVLSVVYLEPSWTQTDQSTTEWGAGLSPATGVHGDGPEYEPGKTHATNTSLISLVKVTPSTPVGAGALSALPEASSGTNRVKTGRKPQCKESARTKADAFAWRIANSPLVKHSEGPGSSQRTPDDSPRSTSKTMELNSKAHSVELNGVRSQESFEAMMDHGSNVQQLHQFQSTTPVHIPRSEPAFYSDLDKHWSWDYGSVREFRKHPSIGREAELEQNYQNDHTRQLSSQARHNLDRMFKSCADLSSLVPQNTNRGSWDPNTGDSELFLCYDQGVNCQPTYRNNAIGNITHTGSDPNLPLTSRHQGFALGGFRNASFRSDASPEQCPLHVRTLSSDMIGLRKMGDDNLKKSIRRRQAEEDIGRMQEQQLAGLCSRKSAGLGQNRGKSQRQSMNGFVNY